MSKAIAARSTGAPPLSLVERVIPPAAPSPRRRSLLVGAAVALAAGAFAAVPGTADADLAGADRALFAACADFRTADRVLHHTPKISDEATDVAMEQFYVALERVTAMRPATAAGLLAKVQCGRVALEHHEGEQDREEMLALAVLRDMSRPGAPTVTPLLRASKGHDAELIALAAEFAEKDAHVSSPAYDVDDAFFSAQHDRWWQIVHRVTDLPAQTTGGHAAKATILAALIRDRRREDDPDARLTLSLIRDLTGTAAA